MAIPAGFFKSGGRVLNEDGVELNATPSSTSKGNKKLALSGASQLLSSVGGGIPTGATKALLRADVAFTINDDGSAADANDFPVSANTEWVYDGDQLSAVRVFGSGTGNLYMWFFA